MERTSKKSHIQWHEGSITRKDRFRSLGHQGATLWFTGLSGSGKSTISATLEKALIEMKVPTYRLDGDNLRHGLCSDLGFSPDDRKENIRRVGEVSRLLADSGTLCLVSFISPYQADRNLARSLHTDSDLSFIEIFVDTPLEVCEERDPKSLYKKARAGEIQDFTGLDAPYQAPADPELRLETQNNSSEDCAHQCMNYLRSVGILPGNVS